MDETEPGPSGVEVAGRRYRLAVILIVALGLALRLAFVIGPAGDVVQNGDSSHFYRPVAESLADFEGFTTVGPDGERVAAYRLPPLFPAVLAVFNLVGMSSRLAQQIGIGIMTAAGLVLVAEIGRRLHSRRVGVVAAFLAAVHPLWITHSGPLMTEGVVLVIVPAVLLVALWCVDSPRLGRFAGLGVLLGLTALNRSDAVLLGGLIAAALFFALAGRPRSMRLGGPVLALAAMGAVVLPWCIRNSVEVDRFTISLNSGNTLAGANCDRTYGAPELRGSWDLNCAFGAGFATGHSAQNPLSPAELEEGLTEVAVDYAKANRDRWPEVVASRIMRTWGVYPVEHQMTLAKQEGRSQTMERWGLRFWMVLIIPFAIGAVSAVRRRDRRYLLLLAPLVHVTAVSVVIYGSTRMGTAAQPAFMVLAAIGIVAVVDAVLRRSAGNESVGAVTASAHTSPAS